MDALIAHLRATGTGQAKINLIVQTANGRQIGECYKQVIDTLRTAGFEGTAHKVSTWLVEHSPDTLAASPTSERNEPTSQREEPTSESSDPERPARRASRRDPRPDVN